jgi:sodium/potassium-transporting ATPase subunit alpha
MKVDNSALTGESDPQTRSALCTNDNPLETANLAFSGTSVVDGSGQGVVIHTGDATVIGQLAGLVSGVQQEETPLTKEINRCVVVVVVVVVGGVCLGWKAG